MSYKKVAKEATKEYFLPGNSACPGCGLELSLRWTLKALGQRTVVVAPASCTNVIVGLYPKGAPAVPFTNMAFAAGCAAASGIRTGFHARGIDDITVMCWSGDGGAFDIGLQAASGAAERNDDILYVCYDNEAYMNTGTQRSGGTPYGAWTTTTPEGKDRHKKDLPGIFAAHNIPYIATASAGHPLDLYKKILKAKDIQGFKFIHIFAPCPPGWRFDSGNLIKVSKAAIKSGIWILYEIENGKKTISKPSEKYLDKSNRIPIKDYIKLQGRFSKMTDNDIIVLQNWIDTNWKEINRELSCQE
ncbi:MAG: 3-methyl-2-oxobutanoate dehydrogenase subunit beta [Promethearchaeota archaeon]|nr:MAG: 3-methyl-2-oxobutanoate dehydrogenase subunit beta [Candidatus Lokiarchaeota archaeon]